nr:hypothetical protein CKG001_14740 [Bdellovibrio sp. CKG001]
MGYLSFLVIAPATYLFAKSLQRPSLQYLFIGFINVMALMYMYNSLYRDDIAEITREPAIIQDHFLGIVITTENNKRILMAYKSILEKVEPSADRIVTAPRAPLLGAYSKKLYTRLSWPEIKSSAALDTEIKQICSSPEKVTLILSKVNFSSPQRTLADPSSLSPLPKIWETYCGKRLITENYLFLALSNKGH